MLSISERPYWLHDCARFILTSHVDGDSHIVIKLEGNFAQCGWKFRDMGFLSFSYVSETFDGQYLGSGYLAEVFWHLSEFERIEILEFGISAINNKGYAGIAWLERQDSCRILLDKITLKKFICPYTGKLVYKSKKKA